MTKTTPQSPRLFDYHMHTAVTIDSQMTEVQACERAIAQGISEIAFTNHIMLKQPAYITSPAAFAAHWKNIQACQSRYPQLTIRLGIEIDYYPGWEQKIADALRTCEEALGRPFDMVMGAIHELNGVFFSNKNHAPDLFRDRDLLSLYRDYFAVSADAARTGLFDLLAHTDLIKEYTYELTPPLDFELYRSAVEPFVEALLDSNVGMDVNTKGLKMKIAEPFPSGDLLDIYLSRARSRGLEPVLTLGSDAHAADNVGGKLLEGAAFLLEHGQKTLTSFNLRKRTPFEMVAAV